jgi:hypothetical protein
MEQAADLKTDYYDMEFKAFTETALDTFRRLKPVYHTDSSGYDVLFSKAVRTGNKKYSMDIKKVKKGILCLTISETTGNNGKEVRMVNVFDSVVGAGEYKTELARAV